MFLEEAAGVCAGAAQETEGRLGDTARKPARVYDIQTELTQQVERPKGAD